MQLSLQARKIDSWYAISVFLKLCGVCPNAKARPGCLPACLLLVGAEIGTSTKENVQMRNSKRGQQPATTGAGGMTVRGA